MKGKKPNMSVNKLAEFIIANPARQRAILKQLKYPSRHVFASTYYQTSRETIKEYFLGSFDTQILFDSINNIKQSNPSGEHQKKMAGSEIEALNYVAAYLFLEDNFDGWEFEEYTGDNEKFIIHGVEVSVFPDLIVKHKIKTKQNYGLLKIHLSKSYSLTDGSGEYVANTLYNYGLKYLQLPNGYTLSNNHCVSFDVFTESVIICPKGTKRKFAEIEAACKNIAAIWDSI